MRSPLAEERGGEGRREEASGVVEGRGESREQSRGVMKGGRARRGEEGRAVCVCVCVCDLCVHVCVSCVCVCAVLE